MPLTILKLMLETPEMSKLSVKFHTTHTQLENNGPDNQPTDSFNILMDPTQSIFTNPTVLILTEITRLLKLKDQSFQKNKMDGNQRETPTTGLPKLWLANKDGQMKWTHGPSHLTTKMTICQNLNNNIPVFCNSKITKQTNLSSHLCLSPEKWLPLKLLSKKLRSLMLKLETMLTLKRLMISRMPWTSTPSNQDGTSLPTTEQFWVMSILSIKYQHI